MSDAPVRSKRDAPPSQWRSHLAVLCLFAAVTVIATYPLPLRLSSSLAGGDIDAYHNPWVDWWTNHVLTTPGQALYRTDYLFYPDGVSLVFHSFSHTNTALSLSLQPLIGQPAAYNVTILLAYLLSGFGMYLLVSYLAGSTMAGVVGGAVFAFNPYHVFESAHPHLVSAQWIPLTVLCLLRWLRERSRRHLILAAILFLVNALTGWHLMILLSVWLTGFSCYYLTCVHRPSFRRRAARLAVFGLLSLSFVLPFLWPVIREALLMSQPYMWVAGDVGHGLDLHHLVLPPWIKPIGKVASYLGLFATPLALLGAWRRGRAPRLWLGSSLAFLLIAIGPLARSRGQTIGSIKLPWSQAFVPLLRHPFRFHLLVMFGLAASAGYGWTVVQGWLSAPRLRAIGRALTVTAVALITLDYSYWPFPMTAPVVSPFYEQLAQEPGEFAVAPFPADRNESKLHMYYQTIHGKKIVAGTVSRTPPDADRFLREHALLRSLRDVDPDLSAVTSLSDEFGLMADLGIRYLIIQKDQMSPGAAERVNAFLSLHPAYEDASLVAYRTDLEVGRDYSIAAPFTPALGLLRADVRPVGSVRQGTFFGLELLWGASRQPTTDVLLEVALVDGKGTVAQAVRMAIDPEMPPTEWRAGELRVGRYRVRAGAGVPPGLYAIRLSLIDQLSGELMGQPIEMGSLAVEALSRSYAPPSPQSSAEGCFGESLCVLGYDLAHAQDRLAIVIYWQASQLMEQDYVISTRLVDPAARVRVCQRDAAPRDWAYPTTWWDVGEIVSDTVVCDLDSISAGRHELEVAVYDPGSGEVLQVSSVSYPARSEGQLLVLGEVDVP